MIDLGLNPHQRLIFRRSLRDHHMVRPRAQVLNLHHKRVADVTHMLVDGSVTFRADAETSRSASIQLANPNGRRIGFGTGDPMDGALHMNNMIRIYLSYWAPSFTDAMGWVDVPIFTGPVVAVTHDDSTMNVEALGKEHFALRAVWDGVTFGQVNYTVDLIRWVMRRAGEDRFDIPHPRDLPRLTTEPVTLWPQSQPWKHAQKLARSLDRQLYYDGRGVCRLRKEPRNPVWTFRDGARGTITQNPVVSFDVDDVKNLVWVKGRKQKGKERVDGWAQLPVSNPFSPQHLGRAKDNSKQAYNNGGTLLEVIENDHIKTNRLCHEHAVDVLNKRMVQTTNVEFSSVTIPHLEPGDKVAIESEDTGVQMEFRMRDYVIPLSGGEMSVGAIRKMRKGKRAHNRPIVPMISGTGWVSA